MWGKSMTGKANPEEVGKHVQPLPRAEADLPRSDIGYPASFAAGASSLPNTLARSDYSHLGPRG